VDLLFWDTYHVIMDLIPIALGFALLAGLIQFSLRPAEAAHTLILR
jgi:hypothetical protein